jgi:two-component system, cell cycle sensor histidine kinase and response regulator CckA
MESSTFARAIRAVALVVAGSSALWEVVGPSVPGGTPLSLLIVRGGTAAIGVGLALASTSARSDRALHAFAYLLALAIVASNAVAVALGAPHPFEFAAVIAVTVLGAALFVPWTDRAQTVLAVPAALAYPVVEWLLPPIPMPPGAVARGTVLVATAAVASIVGARLADRGRKQLVAAESKRVNEQRADALGRFAGGIAHQFNNLLGGILTHVGVLREDVSMGPAGAHLDEIATAARRGRELTEELMRFTRSDPVRVQPTDAGKVLESVAALARALLPEGAKVHVHAAPALPPLAGDIDHLVHACTQVVLNARDAMRGRPDPRLGLTAALHTVAAQDAEWRDVAPGRYIRIAISDTGRGMDAATVARAFEPFFTTKPMHQATGLGLATLLRVIRDHRGAVRAESEPGRGTTIHLLLPLSKEPLPALVTTPAGTAAPSAVAAPGATILVVDDEAIVRNSLKRALTRFGYRVLEAGDGPTALAAMQTADPPVDLIILDLVLPGGGAGIFELLKAVRPEVRVLISSGYSPDAEASRGLAERVEGFLPKPYELGQLRTAVAQALTGEAA